MFKKEDVFLIYNDQTKVEHCIFYFLIIIAIFDFSLCWFYSLKQHTLENTLMGFEFLKKYLYKTAFVKER